MNKDDKLQLTKERLLEATFQLMEEMEDPLRVTSREIAARAGTKPSMINYCFGSREDLIYSVFMKEYLGFMNEKKIQDLIDSDIAPIDLLKEIHFLVASCLIKNYKFTKAITGYILFKRDLGKESFSFRYVMEHFGGRKTEEECKLIAYELSTMMQLIIYRKDDIKKDFGIDLDDPVQLRRYVDMRIDLLLQG